MSYKIIRHPWLIQKRKRREDFHPRAHSLTAYEADALPSRSPNLEINIDIPNGCPHNRLLPFNLKSNNTKLS